MSRPSGPGLLSAVARIRGIPAVWGARRTGRQGGIADPRAFKTSKDAAVAVGEAESRDPDALREPRKEPDAVVAPRERHKNQLQNAGITRNETAVDIVHHSVILELTGSSWRDDEAKKRNVAAPAKSTTDA